MSAGLVSEFAAHMGMTDEHGLPGLTVRACLPVADIMSLGWIIPLPVDISTTTNPQTGQLQFHWNASLKETRKDHPPEDVSVR